ncbi:MAG TPA: crotonase/enoyl-CoA hydratase family protein [Solirubrobacterales bacterium]|nr:crotonase/enoyl-CoA hydratase family protein [Solirubrobacterales bacterium]
MSAEGRRVDVAIAGHVAEVRLDRPAKHNALDFAMFEAIGAAIDAVAADRSVRAVVLHGAGPSFCSGLDLASFAASGRSVEDMFARRPGEDANLAQRVSYGWQLLPAPVICAVHGNCIGGGAQIALGADLRIVAPDATVSIREVHWGLIPDMGLTRSLPRLVRFDVAKELVLTARMISGEEAARIGLATTVDPDPLTAARELAAEIAARSPDATRRAKLLLERAWGVPAAESLALEEELQRELLGSVNQMRAVEAGLGGSPGDFDDPT